MHAASTLLSPPHLHAHPSTLTGGEWPVGRRMGAVVEACCRLEGGINVLYRMVLECYMLEGGEV